MPHHALTPDALVMIDTIARTGSFAAAARELGKVPSALTYSVRQLEDALDVLLFDRRSRQARFTAAGEELLHEGRRLLQEMEAVSNRVKRVATGWETQLTIAVDGVMSRITMFELCEAFYALGPPSAAGGAADGPGDPATRRGPGTRLRLRTEVLAGTLEALMTGQADLAIGVGLRGERSLPPGVHTQPLGEMPFVFAVAPHHPLAGATEPIPDAELLRYRAVAVADSAQRLAPMTVNLLPGQDVLTVPSTAAKIEAQIRCLGVGHLPEPLAREHIAAGRLVCKRTERPPHRAVLGYAWREGGGPGNAGRRGPMGLALRWWLDQLERPATRLALLERHAGPSPAFVD
ncbi:LysR family transcriptional regulator [Piscinibacter sakaiensis]|uniref:LysR-family transcriptional regulator n=1 Tax=Piscinibacter sakaiensis TaxID=1547922 RepID=A0A0K8NZP8_PISS1|nr:LysR family transcriptional regulator [Piscinibacter sakaiensis]GAP35759.1 LysR-family transcriptional regulator [Piscinibacter sakaiensis]